MITCSPFQCQHINRKFCLWILLSNYQFPQIETYDSILVILDQLTKLVNYKPMKITINTLRLAKIIINMIMQYYGLLDLIVSDCSLVFTSKICLSLCYFFRIKQRLSTAFHSQTDSHTQ